MKKVNTSSAPTAPTRPNSSHKTENIKSFYASEAIEIFVYFDLNQVQNSTRSYCI